VDFKPGYFEIDSSGRVEYINSPAKLFLSLLSEKSIQTGVNLFDSFDSVNLRLLFDDLTSQTIENNSFSTNRTLKIQEDTLKITFQCHYEVENNTICVYFEPKDCNLNIQDDFESLEIYALFEYLAIPVVITRLSDGAVLFGNKSSLALFQIQENSLTKINTSDFYININQQEVLLNALIKVGVINNIEVLLKKSNGDIFNALVSGKRIDINKQQCSLVTISDISSQRNLNEKLKRSKTELEQAQEIAGLASFYYDSENQLTYIAPILYKFLNIADSKSLKSILNIKDFLNKSFIQPFDTAWREVFINGKSSLKCQMYKATGEEIWVELFFRARHNNRNEFIGIYGAILDITNIMQIELELKKKDYQFNIAMEAAGLMPWEIDFDRRICKVNNPLCEFWEVDNNSEFSYEYIFSLTHPNDIEYVNRVMSEHINGLRPDFNVEHRLITPKGNLKWVSASGKVVEWNEFGSPKVMVGFLREITPRKRREQDLYEAKASLEKFNSELEVIVQERSSELQEINKTLAIALAKEQRFKAFQDKFVSLISHEFRTPLTVVMAYSDLVASMIRSGKEISIDKIDKISNGISDSCRQMTNLLDSVTEFNQIQRDIAFAKIYERSGHQIAKDVLTQVSSLCMKPDRILVDNKANNDVIFSVSQHLLVISMKRLIDNAIKYSEPESIIVLLAENDDNKLFLSVVNKGQDLTPEEIEYIFEPFRRGVRQESIGKHRGLGIGLAIADLCVKAMNAQLECFSKDGETTFTIVISKPE